jgi:hypothetical protein
MKARQIKRIKFWTLRDYVGDSGGVICDNDTQVIRKCRVVIGEYGLKWQLVKDDEYEHHYYNETDQECLDNTLVNDVEIVKEPEVKFLWRNQRGVSLKENYSLLPF